MDVWTYGHISAPKKSVLRMHPHANFWKKIPHPFAQKLPHLHTNTLVDVCSVYFILITSFFCHFSCVIFCTMFSVCLFFKFLSCLTKCVLLNKVNRHKRWPKYKKNEKTKLSKWNEHNNYQNIAFLDDIWYDWTLGHANRISTWVTGNGFDRKMPEIVQCEADGNHM